MHHVSSLIIRSCIFPLLLFLLSILAGCGENAVTPEQRTGQVAALVVNELRSGVGGGGDVSGLVAQSTPLGSVEVFVDRSLTMQPYDRSAGSAFHQLVERFDDFIASEVAFYGFGFPYRDQGTQVVARLDPRTIYAPDLYTFANNNYAELFHTFKHDGGTRIVITDGVQSDPADRARLSAVANELHRWISGGGAFAALIYRNAYSGRYYSDLEGVDPLYDCSDRPLVVFVLAPSASAIDDLLARLGPGFQPAHVVRVGGSDLSLRPVAETIARKGERRGRRVARDINETIARGFQPIPSATVVGSAGGEFDGYVPLQFEAILPLKEHPWATLGAEGTRRFVSQLRPEVYAWTLDERTLTSPGRTAGDSSARRAKPILPVEVDSRPAPAPTLSTKGDTLRARFTIPVRRPASELHDYAFLVTLRPTEAGAVELVPEALSTDDDRAPDSCGRVFKLRRLLGAIVLRNYIPGRTLLVADWR